MLSFFCFVRLTLIFIKTHPFYLWQIHLFWLVMTKQSRNCLVVTDCPYLYSSWQIPLHVLFTLNSWHKLQPTSCLSVFDHFVGLALKGLRHWQCMVSIFFQINGLTLRNLVFRLGDYLSKRNVVHQGILPLPIHAQHREVFWLLHI